MSNEAGTMPDRIAAEVRRRRQQRDWTLDVAASRLGISRRLLVQIEAGDANPSLSTLLSIAAGFAVSLVDLVAGTDAPVLTVQTDNATAPILWEGDHGGTGRLLVGSDPLELWQWVLAPDEVRESAAHRPGAREVVLVTQGALVVSVDGAEPVVVRRGQSVLFAADAAHTYSNPWRRNTHFVMAVHDPVGPGA